MAFTQKPYSIEDFNDRKVMRFPVVNAATAINTLVNVIRSVSVNIPITGGPVTYEVSIDSKPAKWFEIKFETSIVFALFNSVMGQEIGVKAYSNKISFDTLMYDGIEIPVVGIGSHAKVNIVRPKLTKVNVSDVNVFPSMNTADLQPNALINFPVAGNVHRIRMLLAATITKYY